MLTNSVLGRRGVGAGEKRLLLGGMGSKNLAVSIESVSYLRGEGGVP